MGGLLKCLLQVQESPPWVLFDVEVCREPGPQTSFCNMFIICWCSQAAFPLRSIIGFTWCGKSLSVCDSKHPFDKFTAQALISLWEHCVLCCELWLVEDKKTAPDSALQILVSTLDIMFTSPLFQMWKWCGNYWCIPFFNVKQVLLMVVYHTGIVFGVFHLIKKAVSWFCKHLASSFIKKSCDMRSRFIPVTTASANICNHSDGSRQLSVLP